MIDAHVHLERGPYTLEWLERFVGFALKRGITRLCFLEHSHRFVEFLPCYEPLFSHPVFGDYQRQWVLGRNTLKLADYIRFVDEMRGRTFPLEVQFGLEVCYFHQSEKQIRGVLSGGGFDFITGSVHWICNWGFDHPAMKEGWKSVDADEIYREYYRTMIRLAHSGLFNRVAHPDSLKCFHYHPKTDLKDLYRETARALVKGGIAAEQSAGLRINYGHEALGMDPVLLNIFKEEGVERVTASDAHCPEDTGRFIKEMQEV